MHFSAEFLPCYQQGQNGRILTIFDKNKGKFLTKGRFWLEIYLMKRTRCVLEGPSSWGGSLQKLSSTLWFLINFLAFVPKYGLGRPRPEQQLIFYIMSALFHGHFVKWKGYPPSENSWELHSGADYTISNNRRNAIILETISNRILVHWNVVIFLHFQLLHYLYIYLVHICTTGTQREPHKTTELFLIQ